MQRREYNVVTKAQRCCKNNKKESEEINMKAGVIGAGRRDIAFTVPKTELKEAVAIIEEHKDTFTANSYVYNDHVAKVSIIGAGMTSNPGVAAKMFEALYGANINIQMISTSEIRITVLIDENDVNRAMRAIHDKFDLGDD